MPRLLNRFLCLAILSGFVSVAYAEESLQSLNQANAVLAGDHPFDLLVEANRNKWVMWPIKSEWAITRMPVGEKKVLAERALLFGRNLSGILDRLAPTLQQSVANGQDEAIARWLMELARWLASSPASGNAILAKRSLDLATLPLSSLVLDESTVAAKLANYQLLLQPKWTQVRYRAEVLNAEIGRNLFDAEGNEEQFRNVYEKERRAAALSALLRAGIANSLKDSSGFFDREPQPTVPTTTNFLGLRNAGMIVSGLTDGNTDGLLALIQYRQRMGTFPSIAEEAKPSEAFIDAWEAQLSLGELENDKLRTLGGTAGRAFERIKTGQFVDTDSLYSRRQTINGIAPLSVPQNLSDLIPQSQVSGRE